MMLNSFRQLGRLSLPIFSFFSAVQAVTFPATAEVHLVFPRNDTYASAELTPIVFAIYNSELAAPLDLSFNYNIRSISNPNSTHSGGIIDLSYVNFTNASDPYYAFSSTTLFNTTEGEWVIVWTLGSANCSDPRYSSPSVTYRNQNGYTIFTTKNGAQQLNLSTATTADSETCADIVDRYFTFNVTGTLPAPPDKVDGRQTCAVVAPPFQTKPTVTTSCPPTVAASAVSSISAAITAKACKASRPVVSCPPKNAAVKASGLLTGRVTWLKAAAFSWLIYRLAL
ncbi:hypothetical protein F5B19DRAFT_476037 [Rostrohypoxylon terebratum]|nr:hypothetical protein F5B19DRAFT_476037 [Rostrohypoxylon terebratum]